VDVLSPEVLFRFPHCSLRVTSVYLLHTQRPPYRSIPRECFFCFLSYPHLVLGDFNLHYPLADPCRSLSETEFTLCARYLDVAFDVRYNLLNTPGGYTHFLFDTISRPSVLDLAFANTALSPHLSLWDTPLPSTGLDNIRRVIILKLSAIMLPPPTAHLALLDLHAVGVALNVFTPLPCAARPTPNSQSRSFDIFSTHLTSLLTSHAPSRPHYPRSKAWWSPSLSSLGRADHKFPRISRLNPCSLNCSNVKSLRRTYFKAMASPKKTQGWDFLSSATPHYLWKAKRFAFGRPP